VNGLTDTVISLSLAAAIVTGALIGLLYAGLARPHVKDQTAWSTTDSPSDATRREKSGEQGLTNPPLPAVNSAP